MSIVVRSLAEQTYDVVRRQILTGIMAPGTPVRQDVIAAELGISKIPLREALGRLEHDGLLSSFPNRGYIVRPLSAEEADEVFALRMKLEPGAVADGARLAKSADHTAARRALAALENDQGIDGADHVTQNRLFHLSLMKPCGAITFQLMSRLHILSERYVRRHLEPKGREERARREHRDILDAWLKADISRLEQAIASHIEGTRIDLHNELAP